MNTGTRVLLRNGAVGSVERRSMSGDAPLLWFRPEDENAEREAIAENDIATVLDEPDVQVIEVLPAHSGRAHHPPVGTEPSEWALKSVVEPDERITNRRKALLGS